MSEGTTAIVAAIKKTMEQLAPPRLEQECLEAWVCRSLIATRQADKMLEAAIENGCMWRDIAMAVAKGEVNLRWVSDRDVYVSEPGPHDTETRMTACHGGVDLALVEWYAKRRASL